MQESLPNTLDDVADIRTDDEWGNPIQYERSGDSFDLFSFGRDGQIGGIGLNAEIYSDGRNKEAALATLPQFFTEADPEEVERNSFIIAGAISACLVGCMAFSSFSNANDEENPKSLGHLLAYSLFIIAIASAISVFLLPLHIPSGH